MIAVRNRKTIYRDGDRCVKVFDAAYSKADVLNEALNQSRIETTGLRVPAVLEVATIDEKWTIVSEYIRGKTLEQLMKEAPDRQEEHLALLTALQQDVHRTECPGLTRLHDKLSHRLRQAPVPDSVRAALLAQLEALPAGDCICHGDFTPSNIIIAGDGQPYILDWSHATRGDAAADAARTYLWMHFTGGEPLACAYLQRFCSGSGADPAQIKQWIPITAAAHASAASAGERSFLLSQIDHMNHP